MSFGGLLNDTCTFYGRDEESDSETGEQLFDLVKIAENVPCALQHSGGGWNRDDRLIRGDNTDRLYLFPQAFEIKKSETVVEVRGRQYRVREITDLGGRKRYLRLDLDSEVLDE